MCTRACHVAAGYGNSDFVLTQLVQKYDKKAYVQTNDQLLSLTDQLRLGVRMIELDTHYFLVRALACVRALLTRARASCTLHTAAASTCRTSTTSSTGSTRFHVCRACLSSHQLFAWQVAHELHVNISLYWDTETIGSA